MKISRYPTSFAAGIVLAAGASTGMACSPGGYIGSMSVFAGNFAIRGCALAQGQLLQISSNTALFSILGTTYGGDGRTTFALPDTRGRSLIGVGTGDGLSPVRQGEEGGQENQTLTVSNMPVHDHTAVTTVDASATAHASSNNADTADPTDNVWAVAKKGKPQVYQSAAPDVTMQAGAVTVSATARSVVGNSGGGQAFSVRNPYIGINWLIQLTGVFPSRN
jgi:microcystin-dependent protein